MGLSFYGPDVHWSYLGFHKFRKRLAANIGLDLLEMEGFGGSKSWDEVDDPLVPLLNHSDCEGVLTAAEMRLVSPRLREMLGRHPLTFDDGRIFGLERMSALKLCDYMDAILIRDGDRALLEFA